MKSIKDLHKFTRYTKKAAILSIRIVVICSMLYIIKWIWNNYQSWNRIPNHRIAAKLSAEGLVSDDSYCNFRIKIDAGEASNYNDSIGNLNSIEVVSKTHFTDSVKPTWITESIMGRYLYGRYKEILDEKSTFYIVDFECHSDLPSRVRNKDFTGICNYEPHKFDYVEAPRLTSDVNGTKAEGSGVLAFCTRGGGGTIKFNTNLINEAPSIGAKWDITQANYLISFNAKNINCDTLSIEFCEPTNFSAMYPIPNKITVSSIEFTDSSAIKAIMSNGLRFHTDFIQLKEMSARRTFLLSALLSLVISLFASLVFKYVFDKKSP